MPALTYGFAPNPIGFTGISLNGAQTNTLSTGSTVFGLLSYAMIAAGNNCKLQLNGNDIILANNSSTNNPAIADTIPIPSGTTIVMVGGGVNSYGGMYLTFYAK